MKKNIISIIQNIPNKWIKLFFALCMFLFVIGICLHFFSIYKYATLVSANLDKFEMYLVYGSISKGNEPMEVNNFLWSFQNGIGFHITIGIGIIIIAFVIFYISYKIYKKVMSN